MWSSLSSKGVAASAEKDRAEVLKQAFSEIKRLDEEELLRAVRKQEEEQVPAFGSEPWRKSRPSRLEQLKDAVTGQLSMTYLSQKISNVVSAVYLGFRKRWVSCQFYFSVFAGVLFASNRDRTECHNTFKWGNSIDSRQRVGSWAG